VVAQGTAYGRNGVDWQGDESGIPQKRGLTLVHAMHIAAGVFVNDEAGPRTEGTTAPVRAPAEYRFRDGVPEIGTGCRCAPADGGTNQPHFGSRDRLHFGSRNRLHLGSRDWLCFGCALQITGGEVIIAVTNGCSDGSTDPSA
jgi:hypothetical protein